jgi:hypothetical protein
MLLKRSCKVLRHSLNVLESVESPPVAFMPGRPVSTYGGSSALCFARCPCNYLKSYEVPPPAIAWHSACIQSHKPAH